MSISLVRVDIQPAFKDLFQDTINEINQEATVWLGRTLKAVSEKLKNINPLLVVIAVLALSVIALTALAFGLFMKIKIANSSAETAKQLAEAMVITNEEVENKKKELETTIQAENEKFQKEKLDLEGKIVDQDIQNTTLSDENTNLKNEKVILINKLEKTEELKKMMRFVFKSFCMVRAGNRLKNENQKLYKNIADLKEENNNLEKLKEHFTREIVKLKNTNIGLEKENEDLKRKPSIHVQDQKDLAEISDNPGSQDSSWLSTIFSGLIDDDGH